MIFSYSVICFISPGEIDQDIRKTHSPLASSSQISNNTIKSYLQWQGPAVGRVRVVSLVAGTEREKECIWFL